MLGKDQRDAIAANRAAWNDSAPYHLNSRMWAWLREQVPRADFSCLDETVTNALRAVGVEGRDVAQFACNNGRECLSLCAMGARSVVGIDQSSAFLDHARALARLSPHAPEFVEANVYDLPAALAERFDVGLITIGAIGWMPDLPGFFAAIARTLRPGGALVIYETHPVLEMFNPGSDKPFEIVRPYFCEGPQVEDTPIVYEEEVGDRVTPSYWYVHTVSDIVMAILGTGWTIRTFREFPHSNREEAYRIYAQRGIALPMCLLITATKT